MPGPSRNLALLTDFYELTMAAGYFECRLETLASFELFVRRLPPQRSYLVAAGLESAFEYLEGLHFTDEEIRFLQEQPAFRSISRSFFDYLHEFRFTGDVHAVDEGTVFFADEPILQVTAPIIEAQIVETYLLSVINFETLVASKAARVVHAARGRPVLEFGTRRAQGPEAGLRAARAACLAGCSATSNVLAGMLYNLPIAGTAAHSWTQIFPSERESFEALLDVFPDTAILLIDTYDPVEAAEVAATLGRRIAGVRLDSGDHFEKSRAVRATLDRHGMHETKIVASGDLNEYIVEDLVSRGAPIDIFGVGTELATSYDAPALSIVYKLVETKEPGHIEYKTKFSEHKAYWPGRKQVFRFSRNGAYTEDILACAGENYPQATPLLKLAMEKGRRLAPPAPVSELRARTISNLECLPSRYKALRGAPEYPVHKSRELERLLEGLRQRYLVPRGS